MSWFLNLCTLECAFYHNPSRFRDRSLMQSPQILSKRFKQQQIFLWKFFLSLLIINFNKLFYLSFEMFVWDLVFLRIVGCSCRRWADEAEARVEGGSGHRGTRWVTRRTELRRWLQLVACKWCLPSLRHGEILQKHGELVAQFVPGVGLGAGRGS